MSLPRPATRLGIVLAALIGLLTLGSGVASAHVTVSSPDAAAGGFGKVVFRVPNESDTASTVRLRIQLPADTPFAFVSYQPVQGWTATLTRTQLDPPVTGEDGDEITEAVSVVDFAADPGAGIAPGQFQEFALSLGQFPDVDSLSFSAVQTYSDGTESAWIEPTVAGQPEPERPAPVLTLAATSDGSGDTSAAADHTHDGETTNEPAGLALFLALLALFVGGGGVVLGWRAGRRTVSS
ncbi:YcnI family copper-binding membrane protein [Geodermatophilus sp. URMC 64]